VNGGGGHGAGSADDLPGSGGFGAEVGGKSRRDGGGSTGEGDAEVEIAGGVEGAGDGQVGEDVDALRTGGGGESAKGSGDFALRGVECAGEVGDGAGEGWRDGGGGGEIQLWPGGAPGAATGSASSAVRITPEGEHVLTHVAEPSITPYLPSSSTATGAAVVVIPGGGHSEIWIDHEGYAVAKWLGEHGVAAFVLQYRLAREKGSTYTVEGTELADTQRAIRTVRSRSREWGIDPQRIGVMGFSAGGELAELTSTRPENTGPETPDAIDRISAKPNFQALLYPAIPVDPKLTSHTPPAFLACGAQDRAEIAQGLPKLYLAMAQLHISAELHVYAGVGHGFGVRARNSAAVSGWTLLFLDWLRSQGFLHGS